MEYCKRRVGFEEGLCPRKFIKIVSVSDAILSLLVSLVFCVINITVHCVVCFKDGEMNTLHC